MKILDSHTDSVILEEMGRRLARARLNRNWTQEELAQKAGLSKRTIERMEVGQSVQLSSFVRSIKALGLTETLERLIPEVVPSPIAQLHLQSREPRRASRLKNAPAAAGGWTWAEEK